MNLIHFLFSEFLEYRFWKNFRTSCKFYSELEAVSHRVFFNRDYCFLCRYVFVFLEKKNFEHFSPYNSYCILRVPLRLELPTVLFWKSCFLNSYVLFVSVDGSGLFEICLTKQFCKLFFVFSFCVVVASLVKFAVCFFPISHFSETEPKQCLCASQLHQRSRNCCSQSTSGGHC